MHVEVSFAVTPFSERPTGSVLLSYHLITTFYGLLPFNVLVFLIFNFSFDNLLWCIATDHQRVEVPWVDLKEEAP